MRRGRDQLTPISELPTLSRPQLIELRAMVSVQLGSIKRDMADARARHAARGEVADVDPWYHQAGRASRFRGRLLAAIDQRLSELRGEAHVARMALTEEAEGVDAAALLEGADLLEAVSRSAAGGTQRLAQRVAAYLRLQATERER